jgi:predicted RNase H-like HicB family nuclease
MVNNFTLEYWIDDEWYVGKLKEVPGIFSQGETLEELEENIRDVYKMMMAEKNFIPSQKIFEKPFGVEI